MILKAEEPVPERHTPLLLQVVNYGIYIVPKHAKRYAEKPDLNCHLEDCVTVLEDTDNVTIVKVKEPMKIKQIIHKASMKKRKNEVMKQPWI